MSLAHVLLNGICLQVDPRLQAGGLTDPLSGTIKIYISISCVNRAGNFLKPGRW